MARVVEHPFHPQTQFCTACGVARADVADGKRDFHCPGGAETSIVAISHLLARRRYARLLGYCLDTY